VEEMTIKFLFGISEKENLLGSIIVIKVLLKQSLGALTKIISWLAEEVSRIKKLLFGTL
jgi:hypothetical protein